MSIRSVIMSAIDEVAKEHELTVAPLMEETVLLNSGLDSLALAVLIARLDDQLKVAPFTGSKRADLPVTLRDFLAAYELAVRSVNGKQCPDMQGLDVTLAPRTSIGPASAAIWARIIETAKRLGKREAPSRSGALVELRSGGPRNFFLVHDGDGDTLLYLNLASRMPNDVTVFGIEPHSIAGVPLAHTRIEDMAGFYVNEVRKKQPHGPYLLGGLCAGGTIAFEMASQLSRLGETIELVAIIEAATPQAPKRHLRMGRLKQVLTDVRNNRSSPIGKAWFIVDAAVRKFVNALTWEIVQRGRTGWANARVRLLRELLARQLPWPRYLPQLSVREIYEFADARYVPKPLCGVPVVLVRALRRSFILSDTPYREIYADETLGWGKVGHGLVVIDTDGGHSTLLEDPFVGQLAAALSPYINRKSAPA